MKQKSKFDMYDINKKLMVFSGNIFEIKKEEKNYVVKVYDDDVHTELFFATFTCTPELFKTIDFRTKSDKGIFEIEVSKIISSNPVNRCEEDIDKIEIYSYIYLTNDTDKIIQTFIGKLIDMKLEDVNEIVHNKPTYLDNTNL